MEKTIFVTNAITATAATDLEGVGVLRWVGNNLYRWIQNKSTRELTVGEVAYCQAGANVNTYIYDGYTAVTAAAGNKQLMAGIVCAASLTADYFGWVLVLGTHDTVVANAVTTTTIAVGDVLEGSNVDTYDHAVLSDTSADYTQTQTALTDSSGGTTSTDTLITVTNSASAAGCIATLAAQIAKIKTDVAALALAKRPERHLVALGAVTAATATTVLTSVRAFVRCL